MRPALLTRRLSVSVSVRVLQLGFKVTSKDADTSEFRKSFNWCIPFLMYYLLGSLSLGFGALKMYYAYQAPDHAPSSMLAVGISLFWICVIMWQMWPPVGFLLRSLDPKPANKAPTLAESNV
jgi:hypothetical protein